MKGLYQRRTTMGNGRTKKPGQQGAVKNPRLLQALITFAEVSDMVKFFVMFYGEKRKNAFADANKNNKQIVEVK